MHKSTQTQCIYCKCAMHTCTKAYPCFSTLLGCLSIHPAVHRCASCTCTHTHASVVVAISWSCVEFFQFYAFSPAYFDCFSSADGWLVQVEEVFGESVKQVRKSSCISRAGRTGVFVLIWELSSHPQFSKLQNRRATVEDQNDHAVWSLTWMYSHAGS